MCSEEAVNSRRSTERSASRLFTIDVINTVFITDHLTWRPAFVTIEDQG